MCVCVCVRVCVRACVRACVEREEREREQCCGLKKAPSFTMLNKASVIIGID